MQQEKGSLNKQILQRKKWHSGYHHPLRWSIQAMEWRSNPEDALLQDLATFWLLWRRV